MNKLRIVSVCCLALALSTFGIAKPSLAGDAASPRLAVVAKPSHVLPSAPVKVCWCVVDPCTGCSYHVSACSRRMCLIEPTLACCKSGLLGRRILTYSFGCCHSVDVVITSMVARLFAIN